MAINWETYLPEVLLDVPACPDSVAENSIKQAAIEFCNQSRVWREQLSDLSTVQGQATYPLTGLIPTDSQMIALHKVIHTDNTRPLGTINKILLDRYKLSAVQQRPWYFNNDEPNILHLYPDPDIGPYTIELFAILKPTRASTSGPDFLYNDWLECIAHGAKARLKAMSKRPWMDKSMVAYHRKEFIAGWVEARIRDAKSNVFASNALQPNRFGIYRSRNWGYW